MANVNALTALEDLSERVASDAMREKVDNVSQMVSDAIQMSALALQETNQNRRENMRPKLKPSFQSLCNKPENEHGDFLFGNNLSDDVRKISTSKSIAAQLAPQHPKVF